MVIKKKMNIIIFGASGSIGIFLLKKYYKKKNNLLLFIKDKKKLVDLKKQYKSKGSQIVKFEILDFNNANIIDGATPPAPKIKTFLFFFSWLGIDFK